MSNLFPKIILVLYVGASLSYGYQKDFGRCLYWIAASLITFSVTFLIKH